MSNPVSLHQFTPLAYSANDTVSGSEPDVAQSEVAHALNRTVTPLESAAVTNNLVESELSREGTRESTREGKEIDNRLVTVCEELRASLHELEGLRDKLLQSRSEVEAKRAGTESKYERLVNDRKLIFKDYYEGRELSPKLQEYFHGSRIPALQEVVMLLDICDTNSSLEVECIVAEMEKMKSSVTSKLQSKIDLLSEKMRR